MDRAKPLPVPVALFPSARSECSGVVTGGAGSQLAVSRSWTPGQREAGVVPQQSSFSGRDSELWLLKSVGSCRFLVWHFGTLALGLPAPSREAVAGFALLCAGTWSGMRRKSWC